MVKTHSISVAEHSAYLSSKRAPYVPNEPHAYPSRSTNLKRDSVNSYRDLLINLSMEDREPAESVRFDSHCNAVLDELDRFDRVNPPNRYEEVYPGITRDSAFSLEAAGLMLAAKHYQQVFDISWHLAAMIAFILGEDAKAVEHTLRKNCQDLNLDYDNLSIALCSIDKYLLPLVNLRAFDGVSQHLDRIMTDMVKFPTQCLYSLGPDYLDLRDASLSPAQRFTTFITFQLAALSQHIFDFIIKDYESEPVRTCMLVSKTTSALIFQGNKIEMRPTYQIDLGGTVIQLEPHLVQSGSFVKSFVRRCL